ncbi:MAG: DUF721 domain-containing protein [Desulfovibrio sp.]|jgi:hypothetical protein|nr:DUF721 domain-containing protein [Desulfovibrio sp.]
MSRKSGRREKRTLQAWEAAEGLLGRLGGRESRRLCALWNHWDLVLGPLASLASPLGHADGVLILGAGDSMALQEITLLSPEILELVNSFMGSPFFVKIRASLLQGHRPLDRKNGEIPPAPSPPPRPPRLGALSLPPDSPLGRYYAAYMGMFTGRAP